jgi:glycosyltransferase involved in cell wall biosynthesis
MRILHIIQRYWPAQGGAESHLGEISIRLVNEGYSVTIATTDAGEFDYFWNRHKKALPRGEIWHRNVRILRFPVRHLPASGLTYPAIRRLLLTLSNLPINITALQFCLARFTPWVPELWHWLRTIDEHFDLVAGMTICFEPLLEAGLRFAQRREIPFVIYPLTHLGAGKEPGKDSLSRFYTMRHQINLVRQSDAVIVQTPTERDFYLKHGVSPKCIHVIGPGVNPDDVLGGDGERFRRRYGLNAPIVFMLTKMSYNKGVMHTIEAMRRLWNQGYRAHLLLAGDILDPFSRYFRRLPKEIQSRILTLGTINETEKRDLLAAGDVLVMPSRTDSFGIAYLEAWLYSKPVIGAQTWGVMDVIENGKDGLLVPFGDINALAEAIAYLLDHPREAAMMGQSGREKVLAQHTWDRKHPKIRGIYRQLTKRL